MTDAQPDEKIIISLCGTPQLRRGNAQLPSLPSSKLVGVLAYLAVERRPVARVELTGLFWPDSAEKPAKASLRNALSILRRALGDAITITRESAAINSTHADCDVWALSPKSSGLFLSGLSLPDAPEFTAWQEATARRIRQQQQAVLRQHAAQQAVHADHAGAIGTLQTLLIIDSFDEQAQRELMRLLASAGRHTEALRQFAEFQRLLGDELGVEPELETEQLAGRIRQLRMRPATNTLPVGRVFFGRKSHLATLTPLLASNRLLTLTGLGGSGKTTLAIALANRHRNSYLDGVCFVPLADLGDSRDALIARLLQALNLTASGDPQQTLTTTLRQRETLLLLDNCEQLGSSARLFSDLLSAAPKLTLLATSRTSLRLRDERQYRLDGLEPQAAMALFEAVVEASGKRVGSEKAVVAGICERLDFLPLAVELAAGNFDGAAVALLAQIEATIDALTTQLLDLPERQRSMQASLALSYRLLSDDGQRVLGKMAVFSAEFSHAAAIAITNATPITLHELQSNHLLRRTGKRYSLHPTVRRFAAEKLADLATEQTHASYFANWLDQLSPDLGADPRQSDQLATMVLEETNLTAAWGYAVKHGLADALRKLLPSMGQYFDLRGDFLRGLPLLNSAETHLPNDPLLAFMRGRFLERLGKNDEAIPLFTIALKADDLLLRQRATRQLGLMQYQQGKLDDAQTTLRAAIALGERLSAWSDMALAISFLATTVSEQGDYAQAEALLNDGVELAEQYGNARLRSILKHEHAVLLTRLGKVAAAEAQMLANLPLLESIEEMIGVAMTCYRLGGIRLRDDDLAQAQTHLERGLAAVDGRHPTLETMLSAKLGDVALAAGDWTEASSRLRQALAFCEASGDVKGQIACRRSLTSVALARGDAALAQQQLSRALDAAVGHEITVFVLELAALATEWLTLVSEKELTQQVAATLATHPAAPDALRQRFAGTHADSLPPWPTLLTQLQIRLTATP